MAANFWTSTHWYVKRGCGVCSTFFGPTQGNFAGCSYYFTLSSQRWLLSRQKVLESQKEDREVVSDVELRAARIFYTRCTIGHFAVAVGTVAWAHMLDL